MILDFNFRILSGIIILGKASDIIAKSEVNRSRTPSGAADKPATPLRSNSPLKMSQLLEKSCENLAHANRVEELGKHSDKELTFLDESDKNLMPNSMVDLASQVPNPEITFSSDEIPEEEVRRVEEDIHLSMTQSCPDLEDLLKTDGSCDDTLKTSDNP